MLSKVSVIILAAGHSSRMGTPKLGLKYDCNTSFLQHIVEVFSSAGVDDIAVVVNETGSKYLLQNKIKLNNDVKIVLNRNPEFDRFYSVKLGLLSLNKTTPVILTNIDNPYIDINVVKLLIDNVEKYDLICPSYNGKGGHPLFMTKKVIENIIKENEMHHNLRDYLRQFTKKYLEVKDPKVLININTPEEYSRYFKIN